MKQFTVKRNDEVISVEVEAETSEKAIEKVQDDYSYENFGQGGALTERDISRENEYLKGKFTATEEDEIEKVDSVS